MAASEKKKILITGATGFVGTEFVGLLAKQNNYNLCLAARSLNKIPLNFPCQKISLTDINGETNWSNALNHCDVVIHTAARVHVMSETATDPLYEFRKTNVEGTLNLARQAVQHGIKRFIFISSIKVNGETTVDGRKFTADDTPAPKDHYAISKYEAEQGLLALAAKTGLEVVIIRPPLIYGPGVKGNLQRMIQWLQKGYPLPMGALTSNKRSFLSVVNLNNLILECITNPEAANQIFLASDGAELSTVDLLKVLGDALDKKPRLLSIPQFILKNVAALLGKKDIWQRLGGSLEIDLSKTYNLLGWKPVISIEDGLKQTVNHPFKNHQAN